VAQQGKLHLLAMVLRVVLPQLLLHLLLPLLPLLPLVLVLLRVKKLVRMLVGRQLVMSVQLLVMTVPALDLGGDEGTACHEYSCHAPSGVPARVMK
jgi:hypothetical protein